MSPEAGKKPVLPNGVLPRGLSRAEAARYVGVSTGTFDKMVTDKLMPRPIRVYGRVLWDVRAVDACFDALDTKPDGADDRWEKMAL